MKKNKKKQQDKNETVVLVDPKVYSLEAVYGAAYLFLDEAYFYLEEGLKSKIKVNIKGKEKLTEKKLENLKDEFLNELLNSDLRDKISKNNKKMREYILGKALSSALDGPLELKNNEKCQSIDSIRDKTLWDKNDLKKEFMKDFNEDWEKDLKEIAIPWEEKYLSSKKIETKDSALDGKISVKRDFFVENNNECDDNNLDNFVAPWKENKKRKISNNKKNKK